VGLDGALADDELGGDLGVGVTADDEAEDLAFSVGEPVEFRSGSLYCRPMILRS
jgi:hypothetical protein